MSNFILLKLWRTIFIIQFGDTILHQRLVYVSHSNTYNRCHSGSHKIKYCSLMADKFKAKSLAPTTMYPYLYQHIKWMQEEWYMVSYRKGKGSKPMNIGEPLISYVQIATLKLPLEFKTRPPLTSHGIKEMRAYVEDDGLPFYNHSIVGKGGGYAHSSSGSTFLYPSLRKFLISYW